LYCLMPSFCGLLGSFVVPLGPVPRDFTIPSPVSPISTFPSPHILSFLCLYVTVVLSRSRIFRTIGGLVQSNLSSNSFVSIRGDVWGPCAGIPRILYLSPPFDINQFSGRQQATLSAGGIISRATIFFSTVAILCFPCRRARPSVA